MSRVAGTWTQTEHRKQPSSFFRYLWSPEWPSFTLGEAVEKLYGPTSPLILLIGCQQFLTRQHTALSCGSCGLISCASGKRFIKWAHSFGHSPGRSDMRHPNYTVSVSWLLLFPLLLWLFSSSPLLLLLPRLFFFNVCELFRYMLLTVEKGLGFEFGPASVIFVTEIKFWTNIYTCTYNFWGIN